ncbi:MAG: Rrf2 family transcriptional regulator [Oscillospiraceae bacterium]
MMISSKGRYALRVMIDLAQHYTGENIPLKEIAARQEISQKYLESIVVILSKAGFVKATGGKGGGYKLSKEPSQYTVKSILKLIEGTLAPVACLENSESICQRASKCKTLPMWQEFYKMTNDFFENITIADLLNNNSSDDYVI